MTEYISRQVVLARVFTAQDVTNLGGVFNGYSFVAGDYLVRDSVHGDFAMAKATFETNYGAVGIPDDAGFNQYVYTDAVTVVNQGNGTFQVTEGAIVDTEPTVEFNQDVEQIS